MGRYIPTLGVGDRETENQPDVEARGALVPSGEGRDGVREGVVGRHRDSGLAVFKCTMTRARRPGATMGLPVSCARTGAYWGQRGMQPAVTSAASHMVSLFTVKVRFSMCILLPAAHFPM